MKSYNKAVKNGMSENEASETGKRIWNAYKDKWASAVLKDMKLSDTKRGRDSVKAVFNDIDFSYKYDNPSKYGSAVEREYTKRHEEMAHPIKTKIRKAARKFPKLVETGLSIKKAISG